MVSQSQDAVGWDGNSSPSRTGSLLSLDGRQRPAPAKTPPSYYDAVRSRHSLSQPRPTENGVKPDIGHAGQQIKYNSLPRPLPQRYPPNGTNGHALRPWPDDHNDQSRPNTNPSWRTGDLPLPPRQMYDSPPKPANHVPLQLRVHNQDRYNVIKRGPEQTESCSAAGPNSRLNGAPRAAERLTVDCNRGRTMSIPRNDSFRSLPSSPDVRSPPALPPSRNGAPRSPQQNTNSLPRRDQKLTPTVRRHTMTPDGSPINYPNYPMRSPMNGHANGHYEPRYSKSGKLQRPLSHGYESRPMPPPVVQLRTGPLGSYPDAETLKRSEYNKSQVDKQPPRTLSHGDVSKQIYVDTSSYPNGQPIITDHLAIPYRIPQVSPKNGRPLVDSNGIDKRREPTPNFPGRGLPSPSTNTTRVMKNKQLSACPRTIEDLSNPIDPRSRRHQETKLTHYENSQTYINQHSSYGGYNNHPPQRRENGNNSSVVVDDSAIYANHQMSFQNSPQLDTMYPQKRSPSLSNGMSYENLPLSNGHRDFQESAHNDGNALYANQPLSRSRFHSESYQKDDVHSPSQFPFENSNFKSPPHNAQKSYTLPAVTPKQRPTLPEPSEMVMITETRGWNGQVNSYPKDVVKPTPRLPRFANIASGTQLSNIPAYQSVINELSTQNGQQSHPHSSDSSTLSLRSGYDSSSSSVRDFGRQPSKSDSSLDLKKFSEGGLKSASSQQCIDKTFLSASMTSLCSDTSSSVSTHKHRHHRYLQEDPNWDRMNEEFQERKDKGSIFSASPWEREEKEKMQKEQVLDARRVRDQEIALLESMPDRNDKQEEWLRILRLEKEFQRRAEQEMKDEDDDEEDEDDIVKAPVGLEKDEKVENFNCDKVNGIPNERLGLKLLDQLLESNRKTPTMESPEFSKSPTEKHFIPLELKIPDRDLPQSRSFPPGNNILQVSEVKISDPSSSRSSKPPIPAPRPSKTSTIYKTENCSSHDVYTMESGDLPKQNVQDRSLECSLATIDISNASGREYLQDTNWMIEVDSFDNKISADDMKYVTKENINDQREHLRIYENITEFQNPKQQNPSTAQFDYVSHTLPKVGTTSAKDTPTVRSGNNYVEKKFPAMGVTSTLSRKYNGHIPNDNDILPALYASSKLKTNFQNEIPSDLEDKSPEFKKIWVSRPEKLTFQDKIKKFSFQIGENDAPRDRVKNSRAQRELEIKFNDGQRRLSSNQDT